MRGTPEALDGAVVVPGNAAEALQLQHRGGGRGRCRLHSKARTSPKSHFNADCGFKGRCLQWFMVSEDTKNTEEDITDNTNWIYVIMMLVNNAKKKTIRSEIFT